MNILISSMIFFYSSLYGVDPKLVDAIVFVESSYRPNVVGSVGEIGLMQMKPHYLPGPVSLFHPEVNLAVGIRELSRLQRLEDRLGPYWFVAWNTGAKGALSLDRSDIHKFNYVKKVYKKMGLKPRALETPVYLANN